MLYHSIKDQLGPVQIINQGKIVTSLGVSYQLAVNSTTATMRHSRNFQKAINHSNNLSTLNARKAIEGSILRFSGIRR